MKGCSVGEGRGGRSGNDMSGSTSTGLCCYDTEYWTGVFSFISQRVSECKLVSMSFSPCMCLQVKR